MTLFDFVDKHMDECLFAFIFFIFFGLPVITTCVVAFLRRNEE